MPQVGKTTLAAQIAERLAAGFVTLDREVDLQATLDDPGVMLESLGRPAIIDEVQRAGDRLVLAIKQQLDRDRSPGQYLLTGSSNFLTTPTITESLAGRVDLITLWPLSVGELTDGQDAFVERAFAGPDRLLDHRGSTPSRIEYLELVCRGGYPEVQSMTDRARRRWFERYIETTFLVHRVRAWSRKLASKVVRRPKIHVCDTGLAAAVIGKDVAALTRPTEPATGPLVESFVLAEIAKQLTWADTSVRLLHLRESGGLEVDGLLEAPDGRVVAIEVKATTVPRPVDAAPMAIMRDRLARLGSDFIAGVVLHTGDRRIPLGDRLLGLPLADLWT